MNCDWAKDNIILYLYDELADDSRFEFEQHVQRCASCRLELESTREFKSSMATQPVHEISPNFLTSNRMELQEALEHAEQSRSGWGMLVFDFAGWMNQIKLAPALTAALLIVGFAGGAITTYRITENGINVIKDPVPPTTVESNIAAIESVSSQANSNKVTIKYDALTPQTTEGDINDPQIQRLLLMAARNARNSDVQLGSIDILKERPEDTAVREALVYALRYDKNPGVRLKALDGLKSYVKGDEHVRDAVLEVLLHDSNAGVRTEAISLLEPVKADLSVREALQVLATRDQNKYISSQARRILASVPNLD